MKLTFLSCGLIFVGWKEIAKNVQELIITLLVRLIIPLRNEPKHVSKGHTQCLLKAMTKMTPRLNLNLPRKCSLKQMENAQCTESKLKCIKLPQMTSINLKMILFLVYWYPYSLYSRFRHFQDVYNRLKRVISGHFSMSCQRETWN